MAWVDPMGLIHAAQNGGYAVGAFNMHSDETTQALVRAAEEGQAPMFLQVQGGSATYGAAFGDRNDPSGGR